MAAIRAANEAIDPGSQVLVDLISAEEGSLRLRAVLRFIETCILRTPSEALDEFPRIKKIVVATVLAIPTGLAAGFAGWAVLPDATVNLSEPGKRKLSEARSVVQNVPEVQKKVASFYGAVAKNRSVTEVVVSEGMSSPPLIVIPQSEFGERSGIWAHQEQAGHERFRRDIWDVVVTHPVMKAAPLVWKFERDGLPFSAKMLDPSFLQAVGAGTLPIIVQEGVHMQVEIEWSERLEGQRWEPLPRSRRITRVLSPRPEASRDFRQPLFD